MGMSDRIEAFILELLNDENDWIELRRNEMASVFNCVPSQINYVIQTRFNPEHGYMVESRRGGGGYLRIRRIETDGRINEVAGAIGNSLDAGGASAIINSLLSGGDLSPEYAMLIATAVSDRSIPVSQPFKNEVRSAIMKNMLSKVLEMEG